MRAAPAPLVLAWLAGRRAEAVHLCEPRRAEILFGIACLPVGRRGAELCERARGRFEEDFGGRSLPCDRVAAVACAEIASARRRAGRPMGTVDAMIAGIARSRGAALATCDAGFAGTSVALVNPREA